jgi:hypothetical protein
MGDVVEALEKGDYLPISGRLLAKGFKGTCETILSLL